MDGVKNEAIAPPARPIFAIFEGGGAKGIAHVGALKAVEDNRLEIVGVAGTSAGALIATLVAIGLEADDIMGVERADMNILSRYDTSPVALLGQNEWGRFQRILRRGRRALITGGIVGPIANFLLAPQVMTGVAVAAWRRGHFSTAKIATFVDQVIRDRLVEICKQSGLEREIPETITFRVLGDDWPTVLPLKIVATDVDRGSLEVFDAIDTPDVVVAEAVAASIAIPVVFRPALIPSFRPGRFADGGLVANFPIWAVAEDKLAYEREHFDGSPVPIVGFHLSAEQDGTVADTLLSYVRKLGSAALQGSQGAATRFLDDVAIVPLTTTLTLLELDKGWETYRKAREAGRASADRHLRFTLEVKPDRIKAELSAVRDRTLAIVNRLRCARGDAEVEQMRVNLVTPFGQHSLRVVESVHMDADADDRLLLDRRGRGVAEAFREKGLRVFRLCAEFEQRDREFMTKHELALVRASVQTIICVPIFADLTAWGLNEPERPIPAGVLTVDSDHSLADDFRNDDVQSMLADQSAVLYGALSLEMTDG